MKIIADENIAQVANYFGGEGELIVMSGRAINAQAVKDADVLLVRSITRVDQNLLSDSRCKFVGTATSGIDHIDTQWLASQNIGLGWARGSNADSVVDYVFSALAALSEKNRFDWRALSFGIVGCGEVGSRLAKKLLALHCPIRIYDPFLEASHPLAEHFAVYHEVLQQDVVTFHTPITTGTPWPTHHMLDAGEIRKLAPDSILINAARGAVIDNKTLLARLIQHPEQQVVLDAWEGEPNIDLDLFQRIAITTPHIAGYSREGKLNGTLMIHAQFCEFFRLERREDPECFSQKIMLKSDKSRSPLNQLNELLRKGYDVMKDHSNMQNILQADNIGSEFDNLRKTYPVRHQYSAFSVKASELDESLHQQVKVLGFTVI